MKIQGSWKTSMLGIAGLLTTVTDVLVALANGQPIDWMRAATAVSVSVGLLYARDNNKTSEDVKAK